MERYPDIPDGWEFLGHVHEKRGENREAVTCYRRMLEIINRTPDDFDPEFTQRFENLIAKLDQPQARLSPAPRSSSPTASAKSTSITMINCPATHPQTPRAGLLWIEQTEGAKFWLKVMNELKVRGLNDILIAVVDGLKGFPEAITTVYPQTLVQTCIVHLIRNSLAFVTWKDRKAIMPWIKAIYRRRTPIRLLSGWMSSKPNGANATRRSERPGVEPGSM